MGRTPNHDWPVVLADAVARNLTAGQVAREQGCPYGTVYTAAERLGVTLNTDGRRNRWDGIRMRDRILGPPVPPPNSLNLETFPEQALGDSPQMRVLPPAQRGMTPPDTIYVIEEEGGAYCKVGISAGNDASRRVRELRLGNPRALSLVFSVVTRGDARIIERVVHSKLWTKRNAATKARTEWFAVSAPEAIAAINEAMAEDAALTKREDAA